MTQYTKVEIDGAVAVLVMDHPPVNRLSIAAIEEINSALLALRDRPGLKVLVLRGANRTFSEGIDLSEHTTDRIPRQLSVFLRIFEALRMMPVITVAAVEGHAWGAGFELALGCNLLVAAETATFALPQINAGLIPPIATALLPRVAPRRHAMEWILTGNLINAKRLEHDGVVNRLLPNEHFEQQLEAYVAELTGKSGPVLQLARRAQIASYYGTFPEALASVQSLYLRELVELEDAREGPRAVHEGRKPVWKNC
jgi:enoyl-CoA hydratase/carnithine racemase